MAWIDVRALGSILRRSKSFPLSELSTTTASLIARTLLVRDKAPPRLAGFVELKQTRTMGELRGPKQARGIIAQLCILIA